MTKTEKTKYTTPGSHNLNIPPRSEFHRYYQNNLDVCDFSSSGSTGTQINKVAAAIKKTLSDKSMRGICEW